MCNQLETETEVRLKGRDRQICKEVETETEVTPRGRDRQMCNQLEIETEVRLRGRDRQAEDSGPEWYNSSMLYSAEIPFWSGTLEL